MKKKDIAMKTKRMLILLTAAVIWGFAFSAQVAAAQKGLGCFAFNGTRFVIGGLTLVPVVCLLERRKNEYPFFRYTLLPAMGAGVFLFVASTLQQLGINLTQSAGKASFITGLYIVLVPIFSMLLFGKKAGLSVWLGACLAVVGLYLLGVTREDGVAFGDVLVLIGAFFWAGHILWIDRFIDKANPIRFSMIQFFVCGVLGLCFAFCVEDVTLVSVWNAKWEILYAGVLSSGVAYTCQVVGQRGVDPTAAAMVLSLESVFGALGGLLFHGDMLSPRAWIGCALMLGGILLSQKSKQKG